MENRAGMSDEPGEPLREVLRPPGPVRFEIAEHREPGAVSLQIVGELDILTVSRLGAELNGLIRRSEENVIVDLRRAEFIDSSGLQLLLGTQRRLSNESRKLIVVCEDGPVKRVIELARLGEILGLRSGEENPPV